MRQERVYSNRQHWRWLGLIIAAFVVVGTVCCCVTRKTIFPAETRAPETFPSADIVYKSAHGVGFINADGSGLAYVPLVVKDFRGNVTDWWRPVITADNRTLIVKVIDYFYHGASTPSYLVTWRNNELPVWCIQWGGKQQLPLLSVDQNHIFIQTEQGLALYKLNSCGTDDLPLKIYEGILGVPSPDLRYVAYTNDIPGWEDNRFIVIHEISSGIEWTIGMGDYPAWSRDSQWLAYTGTDGIYIVNVVKNIPPRRVLLYLDPVDKRDYTYRAGAPGKLPPEVSWSPDGEWLVYHKWRGTGGDTGGNADYNAIYKLNIETGEEIKIIDGGMYPYWRWPAEQPGE